MNHDQVFESEFRLRFTVPEDFQLTDELRDQWINRITPKAQAIFAVEFGVDVKSVEIEVSIEEGSIWVNIKARVRNVDLKELARNAALALSLVHNSIGLWHDLTLKPPVVEEINNKTKATPNEQHSYQKPLTEETARQLIEQMRLNDSNIEQWSEGSQPIGLEATNELPALGDSHDLEEKKRLRSLGQ